MTKYSFYLKNFYKVNCTKNSLGWQASLYDGSTFIGKTETYKDLKYLIKMLMDFED